MDLKGASVAQRVKEFSGEMITVSAGKLFSSACQEELSLKLNTMKIMSNHQSMHKARSMHILIKL